MKHCFRNAVWLFFFLMSTLSAQAFSVSPESYVVCKNSGLVRTISVEKRDSEDKACVVNYTKLGQQEEVGSGSSVSGCNVILKRVKDNLEKHWWQCRNVENVTVVKTEGVESSE